MADTEGGANGPNTHWDDLRFPVAGINPVGAVSDPTVNTDNGLLEFSATQTNVIAMQAQLPHGWKEGSEINPHVHWRKKTAGAGNVLWRLTFEWQNLGSIYTDVPTVVDATTTAPIGADDGSANRSLLTPFGATTMTGFRISAIALMTVSRIGADALDTYAGVAQLIEVDIHYQIDVPGSRTLFVK